MGKAAGWKAPRRRTERALERGAERSSLQSARSEPHETMATPHKTPTPPSLTKRKSANLSREESGIDSFGQSPLSQRSNSLSSFEEISTPDVTRRLFGVGQARTQWSRAWWLQWTVIACLFALAMWAWLPVISWLISNGRDAGPLEGAHVHIFHEGRCSGESLRLVGNEAKDLCGLTYPSGEEAKDNVASVMIFGEGWELRVYGTCRIAERPADPMLLETLRESGCVDLRYPICGSVEFVPEDNVEL